MRPHGVPLPPPRRVTPTQLRTPRRSIAAPVWGPPRLSTLHTHAHTRTRTHTHTHAHAHRQTQARVHTRMHSHTHTHMHGCACARRKTTFVRALFDHVQSHNLAHQPRAHMRPLPARPCAPPHARAHGRTFMGTQTHGRIQTRSILTRHRAISQVVGVPVLWVPQPAVPHRHRDTAFAEASPLHDGEYNNSGSTVRPSASPLALPVGATGTRIAEATRPRFWASAALKESWSWSAPPPCFAASSCGRRRPFPSLSSRLCVAVAAVAEESSPASTASTGLVRAQQPGWKAPPDAWGIRVARVATATTSTQWVSFSCAWSCRRGVAGLQRATRNSGSNAATKSRMRRSAGRSDFFSTPSLVAGLGVLPPLTP
eukprot:GHVU01181565.1.p1 GENE.GHVU01181565.1~~GHVU01181565.1.p1  ORF type:complete len:433 (-),score=35.03 GHVU01181565.1:592-1701(-)